MTALRLRTAGERRHQRRDGQQRDAGPEILVLTKPIDPVVLRRLMEVSHPAIREQIRTLAFRFIGDGGAL